MITRPVMHSRIETIASERSGWTRNQVAKRFKIPMAQSDAVIRRAIKYGVLSEKMDSYRRHLVMIKNYKFNYK